MPYKVYEPTYEVDSREKDRTCDVRLRVRVAKIEPTARGTRALVATGSVTFTASGKPPRAATTDENGIATAVIEDVPKQQRESRIRIETFFRSPDGETAAADPIRVNIPPLSRRERDDSHDHKRSPKYDLALTATREQVDENLFQVFLDAFLTRRVRTEKGMKNFPEPGIEIVFYAGREVLDVGERILTSEKEGEAAVYAEDYRSGRFEVTVLFRAKAIIETGIEIFSKTIPIKIPARKEPELTKEKRLEVSVGRILPDGSNPCTFLTRDQYGKPEKGHITVNVGKEFQVGENVYTITHTFETADDGSLYLAIKLLTGHSVVGVFQHLESREVFNKTIRR